MTDPRTVLIAGDWTLRSDLYRGHQDVEQSLTPAPGASPDLLALLRQGCARGDATRTNGSPADASAERDAGLEILPVPDETSRAPLTERFALWEARRHGHQDQWRCVEVLGTRVHAGLPLPPGPLPELPADGVLVIDDPGALPHTDPLPGLAAGNLAMGQILYAMARPQAPAPCWLQVMRHAADRTTLILDADSLRAANVPISRGSSWERTVTDTLRETRHHPDLAWLRRPRQVLIRFDLEGVLHLTFSHGGALSNARLLYDPEAAEGQRRARASGDVTDLNTAFLAGLALHADARTVAGSLTPGSLAAGIQTGLRAARALHDHGHGRAEASPRYPIGPVTAALLGQEEALPMVRIPVNLDESAPLGWTILGGQVTAAESTAPLFDLAHRIAVGGVENTWAIPHARLGQFQTVDRSEIESIAALRQLIERYRTLDTAEPLGIGLFSPPGAGKSFFARQLAADLLGTEPLEFNLSQFDCPSDIRNALRQTRNAVLRGELPVVVFDEFDGEDFRWIQPLLGPLRDGKFQEGGTQEATGRCVFLFASTTAWTHAGFGVAGRKGQWSETFVAARGPEFKSSLATCVDLLGPNPRILETKVRAEAQARPHKHADPSDITFPLRRALALRHHLLGDGGRHLEIDSDLLDLLLTARHYRGGHRSLHQIARHLKASRPKGPISRSSLPSRELLEPHLGNADLDPTAGRSTSPTAHRLALALAGFPHGDGCGPEQHRAFAQLPRQLQADHFAAAHRIAKTIQQAGLQLASLEAPAALSEREIRDLLEQNIEQIAAAEHDLRVEYRLQCGWRYGPRAAAAAAQLLQIQHDTLIPYPRLTDEDKELEREAARRYVDVIRRAGFSVTRPAPTKDRKKAKAKPKASGRLTETS